jgi:hypothetical protein
VTAGVVPALGMVVALLAAWRLIRALVATVRSDGYGRRPPPARLGPDPWQR